MKKNIILSILPAVAVLSLLNACTRYKDVGVLDTNNYTDTTAALKDVTDNTVGVAIDFPTMVTNTNYSAIVKRDFDRVTFGYHMKHGAIVRDNGNMDFTNTDALVAAVGTMDIFGHTLGWHANQNATYLRNYSGLTVPAATELLVNAGFELGGAGSLNNWSTFNALNGSSVGVTTASGEVRTGARAMKVVANVGEPANQWKVQVASDLFNTIPGRQYVATYYVKAASGSGSIRLSTQTSGGGSAQYQGDQTIPSASFTLITWTFTANSPQTRILFDMGASLNSYFIDDASVKEVIVAPTGPQIAAKLDTALGNFITTIVNRYKTKVKAWDVVNELLDDNGNLRNNANSPVPAGATDWLVWSQYLGRDYAFKAFKYAEAADPAALLFINDYNLESRPVKLDSLIKMVNELKGRGAKIDGIGTQMHITRYTSYSGIDAMFAKLAATGLKIHVSELDVKINPNAVNGYVLTPLEENYQAQMYNYVMNSYLRNVPKAQQFGITIWGVTDNTSWLYNGGREFPLLYNANYRKKQAYTGVLNGLQGK
ncbi:MAG: endo-1,4-beta-xylanase [Bacteroidetes bacterium]|nr:endo-1,4-beta-xylanase [Bacteroidota bacterium]